MIIITVLVTTFMLASSLFYELFYLDSFKYYGIIIIVMVILITVIITEKTEDHVVSYVYLIINIRFSLLITFVLVLSNNLSPSHKSCPAQSRVHTVVLMRFNPTRFMLNFYFG